MNHNFLRAPTLLLALTMAATMTLDVLAQDADRLEGVYEVNGGCGQPDTGGTPQFCYSDRLRLIPSGRNAYDFEVETSQSTGHRCALEGNAKKIGQTLVFERGSCKLTFALQNQGIRLRDDHSCKEQALCGARASLDGLYFPFANRKKPQ